MRTTIALLLMPLLAAAAPAPKSALVTEVRALISRDDFTAADKRVRDYFSEHGATSELAAAVSWMGRGALERHRLDSATNYAGRARTLVEELLKGRSIDADRHLATALGAAIEVEAQVMSRRHEDSAAIEMLERELKAYGDTTLGIRIQKNLNMLVLVGKTAPALDLKQYVGRTPEPLASQKGRPVVLYFWAHWCPECKAMAPVLARIQSEFGAKGLEFYLPTALYGYTKRGEDATPAEEMRYIEKGRNETYTGRETAFVPVGVDNLRLYGSSTVPTMVLVDRQGVVRLFQPGKMTYEELAPRIAELLR